MLVVMEDLSMELFFFVEKKLSESFAEYHNDMNGKAFKDWFGNVLLPNLPKERNVVIVMDNAKYHSRLVKRLHQ